MIISRRSVAPRKLAVLSLVAAGLSCAGLSLGVLASTPAYAQARKPKPLPWAGEYSSKSGDVEIRPDDGESFDVAISGADPEAARWTCELEGKGRIQPNGTLLVEEENGAGDSPARISLALKGDRLTAKDVTAPEPPRSYCGLNGTVDGVYRRKKATSRTTR